MRAIPLGRRCGREEPGRRKGKMRERGLVWSLEWGGGDGGTKGLAHKSSTKNPFSVCPQCHPSCRGTHSFLYCLFLIAAAEKSGNFSSQVSQSGEKMDNSGKRNGGGHNNNNKKRCTFSPPPDENILPCSIARTHRNAPALLFIIISFFWGARGHTGGS